MTNQEFGSFPANTSKHWTKKDFVIRGFREQREEEGRKAGNDRVTLRITQQTRLSPSFLPAGDNGDHSSSCPPLSPISWPLICIQVSRETTQVRFNDV